MPFPQLRTILFSSGLAAALLATLSSTADNISAARDGALSKRLSNTSPSAWLRGIFRVNTDVSAGDESLSTVCAQAKAARLDFIVVSDQFLVKAEYGIWPFRRVLSYSIERKSVEEFGVERYLSLLNSENSKPGSPLVIPGVDVAPYYYWIGIPFSSEFGTRRFSEQLTVFGSCDPEFYRSLPVIHNRVADFSWRSIIKLLPLLLTFWGAALCLKLKSNEYRDATGKLLSAGFNRGRFTFAVLMMLTGILWTLNNQPFSRALGCGQYADAGLEPYRHLIDYVRSKGGEEVGVVWSAPEANMRDSLQGVSLVTTPYLSDVLATFKHNGMAGLYGDAVTALRPGGEWDEMLLEHCGGKRVVMPIIVGELDYHGGKRRISMYQTVVRCCEVSRKAIVGAILAGRSFAYAKSVSFDIEPSEFALRSEDDAAELGDTLLVDGNNKSVTAEIAFALTGTPPKNALVKVLVVANGKLVATRISRERVFHASIPLSVADMTSNNGMGYVRFVVTVQEAEIATNPIFVKRTGVVERPKQNKTP